MTKYRTNTHDAMPPPRAKAVKPGKIGATKLGVYDHGPDGKLRLRGQVGALATGSTAARFHGQLGSTIRTVAGRKAWVAPAHVSGGAFGTAQKAKLARQLRTIGAGAAIKVCSLHTCINHKYDLYELWGLNHSRAGPR